MQPPAARDAAAGRRCGAPGRALGRHQKQAPQLARRATGSRHHRRRVLPVTPAASGSAASGPAAAAAAAAAQTDDKRFDVVALGNLCVDVVVSMPELPPVEEVKRPAMLERLTVEAADGGSGAWEAGAQSNFMIAAARLGLRVASAANVGQDVYGDFLTRVLREEGVQHLEPLAPDAFEEALRRTLICFVLVGPDGSHQFCSRYDFGPWPLLPGVHALPVGVLQTLRSTRALFLNGFVFDELPGPVVLAAAAAAAEAGAACFFDPGPRAWTLRSGERRAVMDALLDASDVVLMTQEEAEAVTGEADPEAAAVAILERPGARTQWCVVKLGPQGALLRTRSPPRTLRQPALQIPVADTVGCGDSFAAAIVLGYIQRRPLEPLLALANAVGAATATATGAGRNVASADTVRRLLSERAQGSAPGLESGEYGAWADRLAAREVSAGARESSLAAGRQQRREAQEADAGPLPAVAAEALQLLDENLAICK